jgi:hypothetical protein
MKSIYILVLLICTVLSTSGATSQQLSMLVYDFESEKAAVLTFEAPENYSICALLFSSSALKCECLTELVKVHASPQDQIDEWMIQADLFPHPRVFQSANTPLNTFHMIGPGMAIFGIGLSKREILKECAAIYTNTSGFLEQRLLETSEKILELIPQFQSGNLHVMLIENAPSSDVKIDAEINQRASESTMVEELRNLLAPGISNSICELANDTKVNLLENKRTIVLIVPESLLSFALQIKVMGENQITFKHQALNRAETRVILRQEQWKMKKEIQIIQASGKVIWQKSWTQLSTE